MEEKMDTFEYSEELDSCIEKAVVPETVSGTSGLELLTDIVAQEAGINKDRSAKIIHTISDTIDSIDLNYRDLKAHKEKGGSTKEWLQQKLEEAVTAENKTEQIQQLLTGMEAANRDMAAELARSSEIEETIDYTEGQDLGEYAGLNKKQYAQHIIDAISNNTLLHSVQFEDNTLTIPKECREHPLLKQYFEAPLDAEEDSAVKKAVSAGFAIAREKNLLPKAMETVSDEDLAHIVERGLTQAKTAYKVGTGEISPIAAINYCIDRTASTVASVAKKVCSTVGTVAGKILGGVLGSKFGPAVAKAVSFAGGVIGQKVGKTIGTVIGKGVKMIASAAKTAVKTVAAGAKKLWTDIKNLFS